MIPNTVALVGVVLHQQVVPIELSGTGSITALTGTNAWGQPLSLVNPRYAKFTMNIDF